MYRDPALLNEELVKQRELTRILKDIITNLSMTIRELEAKNADLSARIDKARAIMRIKGEVLGGMSGGECPCHLCGT